MQAKGGGGGRGREINLEINKEREREKKRRNLKEKEHKRESKNPEQPKEKGEENPYCLSENLLALVKEAFITVIEVSKIVSLSNLKSPKAWT